MQATSQSTSKASSIVSMPALDFDNIQNAFSGRSNKSIRRAYWLFRLIGYNWLVKIGTPFINLAITLHLPVRGLIKRTIFRHFCGGENIYDCDKTIKKLYTQGVGSILDYSVEGRELEADFDKTCAEIIATVVRAKGDPAIPFSVFKVTGIARFNLLAKVSADEKLNEKEHEEFNLVRGRVEKICAAAAANNVRIFIDAEETWIQSAIDDMAGEMMKKYNGMTAIVYNTIQLYRTDRLAFLKKEFEKSLTGNYKLGMKLVRGAYMEKERERAEKMNYPDPIQPDKKSCDRDYDEAIRFCIEHIDRIAFCAGTHNEASSLLLARLMSEKGIAFNHSHIYFSQLLGMSDHISFNLCKAGFNVAKYVPYGPVAAVMPYLLRRAAENTSIAGQTSRELSLVTREMKRRKLL
jgi:proline dehydrogenase